MQRTANTAYCPAPHDEDPAATGPQADKLGDADWSYEYGRVEVFACRVCGTVFGLDRHGMFCPVPDDFAS
jgi:rubrerythrin